MRPIDAKDLWDNRPEWRNESQVERSEYNKGWNDCLNELLNIIKNQPTVDAVPVVRCRECKHWGDHDVEVPGETDKIKACGWAIWRVGENGYCVFGERRDEA